ncbi:uncharacterized protein LOC143191921 [Rhynchophorus ferrugineus]|uniref:Uncharacterized protein n=1 Tax=Rhynchophorus ferrugineus TaxID=354439 RepID=A0A834MMA3_RHYFE|nr:hypothetical protein GWI33_000061 [Rhynchophorus ferrugineus]
MWNLVFLIAIVQLYHVTSKPIGPTEPPLWFYPLSELIWQARADDELTKSKNSDQFFKNLLANGDSSELLPSLKSSSSSEKRALSMFARWGPVNSIGKERNPIRSEYRTKALENISTQTRGRIMGQPLRWG